MGHKKMKIPIAKEAFKFVIPVFFLTFVLGYVHAVFFFLGAFLTVLILFFFRDPRRSTPLGSGLVISPADGKIVQIRQVREENEIWNLLSIFMSPCNVHINYAPIDGEVLELSYRKGSFLRADQADASSMNESNTLLIRSQKMQVRMKQIAGIFARRIVCYSKKGDILKAGEKIGLIQFGSRVDLYLAPFIDLKVKVGDKVRGGLTVLGTVAS